MMKMPLIRQRLTAQLKSASALASGLLLCAAAFAAQPFFSGPSVAKIATEATFSGSGFTPNAAVTVMVKAPSGQASGYSAVVAADGSFSYRITPQSGGAYTLTVTDSSGKALASAVFSALP
jgi:hypothetical protein